VEPATQDRIAPSEESVRAAVRKISASPRFATSERLCRFLCFAVEETLGGNTDKLKEIVLGAEVFDRKPDYDPRLDAVVRIEAVEAARAVEGILRERGFANWTERWTSATVHWLI
jgi:hypothetical protein